MKLILVVARGGAYSEYATVPIITYSIFSSDKKQMICLGRVEHWRQINGKKNSERLIFKFSHKKDIVRYSSHYAQRWTLDKTETYIIVKPT